MQVAVVQQPPVLLDRDASLKAAVAHLHEAADAGAELVVFPEAYVPGYPAWIWWLAPGGDGYRTSQRLHELLLANAVDLAAGGLAPLQDAAAARGTVVVCGVHERDGEHSRGTLYNTLVTIGPDGHIANRHRKLMPTNPERMVWGQGDAAGLRVVDTPVGRIGGLLCWENYMPLSRFALYAEGVEVLVASTWDSGDVWVATMQHIAAEGRCWVIGSGCSLRVADVPASFPSPEVFADAGEWLNPGDSVIVAPGGRIVAGPLRQQHGVVCADIDPVRAVTEKRTFDVAGHYGRPDVFTLTVDRSPRPPVRFEEERP